ncbi:GRB2-associated-binding protein 1 isoform X1 [Misgurnus anguillicaudatus]|uniref:GRB2-associated-binding protein 1 isoform X1 n=2 Tax=Misgurnus anguillicaudatus TaxID=75329 RepID=UPI002435E27D|nr:GRB2-associated-binding protein 1 isoform X8 [Misgurnus anguillicaudatus]XP_055061119.1 GRB2-associated-binding protein 1 isoform X8 [Misgurnus anguillicaudatus]XP_055061120.1 GRB2-associated-binding protein 1 isoform X8 [Misgurnus anguillicaudatus]
MSGGEVVCSGWLRKSPPEKKLRRYAWKKRWFVLRSGRLTGDPDVLEYYKNDHAKKPIRVIDLNLCEQVDAGLTFNKKDLEHSFIFDIKTIDRIFYLVADTEEEMNKWVRCICDICGFNPTDSEDSTKVSHQPGVPGGLVVDVAPNVGLGGVVGASALGNVPPPYQPVNVRHLESSSSQDEPQDYLWLAHCESKKPEPNSPVAPLAVGEEEQEYLLLEECETRSAPLDSQAHADCSKSTSSEPDCNDNLPSHCTPTSASSSKHASVNGFFPGLYDSPPSRGHSLSADSQGLYHLPRSYSQDTVLLPKSASSPPAPDGELDVYVFNTPARKPSLEAQLRNLSVSYDIPPTPGRDSTYQVPRTAGVEAVSVATDVVPPPRPPKPSLTTGSIPPDRSPTDTYVVPRSVSETDGNYCVPSGSGGNKALRSNTIGTMDSSRLRRDYGSQDCYDVPRPFPSDNVCSFDFNESFNTYFKNKGMVPVGSTEEVDENYVPMSVHSSSHHRSGSLSEPIQEANYVPMTPGTEFSSLGKQVPPPAHMGFRSSPKTPPRRPMQITECQPPPIDRNLKPDRKGQSPKINRAVGLERTDSQTIGEFSRRRKDCRLCEVKPAPLEIKTVSEWEELTAPVRSPVTRSFTRDPSRFPMPPRPPSGHSTASSTDSEDCDENYVTMHTNADEPNMKLGAPMNADGGGSPMVKPKGDKQVEYLDLDLDPGKSTPPRKKKTNGTGISASDERVDYVVVDQQRTQALKSTREAWSDGRQSTETDTPNKGTK